MIKTNLGTGYGTRERRIVMALKNEGVLWEKALKISRDLEAKKIAGKPNPTPIEVFHKLTEVIEKSPAGNGRKSLDFQNQTQPQ